MSAIVKLALPPHEGFLKSADALFPVEAALCVVSGFSKALQDVSIREEIHDSASHFLRVPNLDKVSVHTIHNELLRAATPR